MFSSKLSRCTKFRSPTFYKPFPAHLLNIIQSYSCNKQHCLYSHFNRAFCSQSKIAQIKKILEEDSLEGLSEQHYIPIQTRTTDETETADTTTKQKQQSEDALENFESSLESDYNQDNEIFLMTARQKIRDWTRMYHKQQSAKWIKNQLGIPLLVLVQKYEQARNQQRIYATRILRREGHHQQWKPHALINAVHVKLGDKDGDKSLDYDSKDLDYFFYHKPPVGYVTNDNPNAEKQPDQDIESYDEQLLIDCLNYCFEQELEKGYDHSYHHLYGKEIFSYIKKREKRYRDFAANEKNAVLDDNGLLKRADPTKKLNMFSALPEENPRSEYIQYGGRFLSDFVDFKHPRLRQLNKSQREAILLEAEKKKEEQSLLMSDSEVELQSSSKADYTVTETEYTRLDKNPEKQKKRTKKSGVTTNETLNAVVESNEMPPSKFDDSTTVTDIKKTEGYDWNVHYRWFKGDKIPDISIEDNIKQVESIDFDEEIKTESVRKGEYPTLKEDEKITKKRELIDLRDDIKNTRNSSWFELKRGFPQKKEISYLWSVYKLRWKRAWQQIKRDYRFVFKSGGGEILRQGCPPQISIMEFTAEDQLQTALGSFGPSHTLYSDWFLTLDNKREEHDRSTATANIVDDRLVFKGFLMHSGIEMGHRTRNFNKDWIGFATVASHEFEPEWDLGGFHSIGMKIRTDGRPYFLGLECLNRNKFILFNGIIQLPPTPEGDWDYYEIPFHHFRPYYGGEFMAGESWHKVRYLRSIGIQAVGGIGEFHFECQWIRAFREDARFDLEDEEITFINDLDGLGLYEKDIFNFNVIQHQFFSDCFPDPFRFEDNGVFDDFQYLGPPRSQREHFSKLDVNLLKYIDLCDDIPLDHLTEEERLELESFDHNEMLLLESHVNDKMIGDTKAVQQLYKHDNEAIETTTNALLFSQLKRENSMQKSVFFKVKKEYAKPPFKFHDFTQISAMPLDIVTRKRRDLLRELVPRHLRERDESRWPKLV